MFGHGPEFVTEAVHKQIDLGVEIGPQSSLAGEVADLICELTGMERAAFCNTGSEAVMAALRVARTVTARDKIVLLHRRLPWHFRRSSTARHSARSRAHRTRHYRRKSKQRDRAGVRRRSVVELIRAHGSEIAAVLVEPMQSAILKCSHESSCMSCARSQSRQERR